MRLLKFKIFQLTLVLFCQFTLAQAPLTPPVPNSKANPIPETKDWANLKKYASQNESIALPAKKEKRVVFMGNSITEKWSMIDYSFFEQNPLIINRGISGQTTSQMLIRFRPDVIALKPKVVVILAGTNDIAENQGPATLEQIAGTIYSMAELAKEHKIKVVLCSVLPANSYSWREEIEPADKIIALNELIKAYAKKNKLIYVDFYPAMVNNDKGLKKEYGRDSVHPNLEGYHVMEPLVLEAIIKALK